MGLSHGQREKSVTSTMTVWKQKRACKFCCENWCWNVLYGYYCSSIEQLRVHGESGTNWSGVELSN